MSTCSVGRERSFNMPKVQYLSTWIFVNYVKPCLSVCHSELAAVCLSPCVYVSVSLIHKKE